MNSISISISSLSKTGDIDVANALKNLTEAVVANEEISTEQRTEIIDLLEELSTQATLSEENKTKKAVIKSILNSLGKTLEAFGALATMWSTWGPTLHSYFGL